MLNNEVYKDCHARLVKMLIRERKKHKIGKFQLANLLNVSSTLIHRLESGDRRIDVCDLLVLAHFIGFDPVECIRDLARHCKPKAMPTKWRTAR